LSLTPNRRTIASYERYARTYAAVVAPQPSGVAEEGLGHMLARVRPGGSVLEIGSGPGWDADYVESRGFVVRRTDITAAFREFQAERGKHVEPLDVITDELGGPYDAAMALCVLLHIERDQIDDVLRKVAGALEPGGVFLLSTREGRGELWENGQSGDYRVVFWEPDAFAVRLATSGLGVEWSERSVDDDGSWLHFLARKQG
jgi:SAM-dependent methyltransferase